MPRPKSKLVSDQDGWRTVRTETLFESAHLELTRQEVLTPTREEKPVKWTVVHRPPAVVIAPVTAAGKYVLLRQERIPIRATLWEFPAGQIDEEDADDETVIRDTAIRELREETGYELPPGGGRELIALGHFFSSQGFTDEHCYLFLARGVILADAGASHDEDEGILECREFSGAELTRMVAGNEIVNANALSVYARLCARGLL
jgi:8-oxo-dGTP pyrophosphatase MutT (NUDIX family)